MDEARRAAFEDIKSRLNRTNLRFAVCGPKGCSSAWTAFASGNDYYIGARSVMGSLKTSLHATGDCRMALTTQYYESLPNRGLLQPPDRAMAKWRRPETPTEGAVHVASIHFPSDHLLQAKPAGNYRKPLIIFGNVPPGKAFEFAFFYSREEIGALRERFLRFGEPLCSEKLTDGTTVSLVYRVIDFDRSMLPPPERLRGAPGWISSKEAAETNELAGLTAIFGNQPEDGKPLILWEIGGVSLRRNP